MTKIPSVIKTVYDNDKEIIEAILTLYAKSDRFNLDPTFSLGKFYKGLNEPAIKGDLYPQRGDVLKMDTNLLEIPDNSISSICFDPPFLAGFTTGKTSGIIGTRFEGFRYMKDVWEFYNNSLSEFHRILQPSGVLAFKCQDTVSSGKQFFSHCHIMSEASKLGFKTEDLFIKVAKNRIIGHNHKIQKHARKYHSYWLVFIKKPTK